MVHSRCPHCKYIALGENHLDILKKHECTYKRECTNELSKKYSEILSLSYSNLQLQDQQEPSNGEGTGEHDGFSLVEKTQSPRHNSVIETRTTSLGWWKW